MPEQTWVNYMASYHGQLSCNVSIRAKAEKDLSLPLVLPMSFQRVLSHNQRKVVVNPAARRE